MIKILFFIPHLTGGGAERVTLTIIRQLDPKKFSIFLVTLDENGKLRELIPNSVEICCLRVNKTMFSIFELRTFIKRVKPDFVYSTLFRTHIALNIAMAGLKNNIKFVCRSPNSPELLIANKEISYLTNKLVNYAYVNADLILAQTPEMQDELVKFYDINKDKIKVLINPVDVDFIDEKIKGALTPFEHNGINVVAAGRLTMQKGFDKLIESFKLVVEKNNSFRLFLIGEDQGMKASLLDLVERLDLSNHVKFLDYQSNPYRYFKYSDLYVLSSRWEGLPNTILENLYLKKPIVSTRCIPYINELIEHNKNGILVNVGDVESMAKAILNYKIIDVTYESIEFNGDELGDIFDVKNYA